MAVRNGVMVVEVEDDLWRRNLAGLRHQLLKNLRELLDSAAPSEIEYRIGIPRRPPAREVAASADEADSIVDPVLRRIYINSRRKALAS